MTHEIPLTSPSPAQLRALQQALTRFMMSYQCGLEEMQTKIATLKREFELVHAYNPIEHVKARLKTPTSILKKIQRRGYEWTLASIRENVRDIAGIRVNCSFVSDIYKVCDMLEKQHDITIVEYKDYISSPKPNGYQSLHLIVHIPVFIADKREEVYVEVQIRTIAMDFWASLEHKIYYKYDHDVPHHLRQGLKETAETIAQLDKKMEQIHHEMQRVKKSCPYLEEGTQDQFAYGSQAPLPLDFLSLFLKNEEV